MSMFRTLMASMAQDYVPTPPNYPTPTPSPLPVEYQQVEYIQSTGAQYLDTGISCAGGVKCTLKTNVQNANWGYLCGAHALSDPYGRCGVFIGSGFGLGYGNIFPNTGSALTNTDYDIEFQTYYNNAYLKVKGGYYLAWTTLISDNTQTVTADNFMIFAQQYAVTYSESLIEAKLYSLKIYDSNDDLVGDYLPCYRKADNIIGLYNLVDDTFITNQGTGTFIKGPDV